MVELRNELQPTVCSPDPWEPVLSQSPLPLGWRPLSPGSGFTQQETDWGFRHHAAVKESIEWRQEGCVKSGGGASFSKTAGEGKPKFLISTWSYPRHSNTPGPKTDPRLYTYELTCGIHIEMQCITLHSILMSAADVFPTSSGFDDDRSTSVTDLELRFLL
ncbi:uncharacterized [Tachysurus ichikawai]